MQTNGQLNANRRLILSQHDKVLIANPNLPDLRSETDSAGKDDIEIFYTKKFKDGRKGFSYPDLWMPDSKYSDAVILNANHSPAVLAHEVGHILENLPLFNADLQRLDPHFPYGVVGEQPHVFLDRVNLMVEGAPLRFNGVDEVVASRRLNVDQETRMLANRPNLLRPSV